MNTDHLTATGIHAYFGNNDTLLRQHCLELAIKDGHGGARYIELAQEFYDFIKGANEPELGPDPSASDEQSPPRPNSFEANVEPAKTYAVGENDSPCRELRERCIALAVQRLGEKPYQTAGSLELATQYFSFIQNGASPFPETTTNK